MTGLEGAAVAAAGKVAAGAVQHAQAHDRDMKTALLKAAEGTEGFADAADMLGRKVAVRQALTLVIYRPLARMVGLGRDYFDSGAFNREMAGKLQDVPEEHIQEPRPSIAVPAMEGLSLTLDEPALKELYLELLAKASDDRQAGFAHPAFVGMLKELTSEEALYLPRFIARRGVNSAIVQLRAVFRPSGNFEIFQTNLLGIFADEDETQPIHDPMVATYVDNWVRLGLVEVDWDSRVPDDTFYDWATDRPEHDALVEYVQAVEMPLGDTSVEPVVQEGIMRVTPLGKMFSIAVGIRQAPRMT